MKSIFIIALTVSSLSAFAKCKPQASDVAIKATNLYVSAGTYACRPRSFLEAISPLATAAVMPPRYAYEATVSSLCGGEGKEVKVTMNFNQFCELSGLKVSNK